MHAAGLVPEFGCSATGCGQREAHGRKAPHRQAVEHRWKKVGTGGGGRGLVAGGAETSLVFTWVHCLQALTFVDLVDRELERRRRREGLFSTAEPRKGGDPALAVRALSIVRLSRTDIITTAGVRSQMMALFRRHVDRSERGY